MEANFGNEFVPKEPKAEESDFEASINTIGPNNTVIERNVDHRLVAGGMKKKYSDSEGDEDADNNSEDEHHINMQSKAIIEQSMHPYKHLLKDYKPTEADLAKVAMYDIKPWQKVDVVCVDNPTHLEHLSADLMDVGELGVTIECDKHAYMPQVCLLVLSTVDHVYLVDSLALRTSLSLLQPVFASRHVLKVVYSRHVLRNLQLDYDLWFVNAFCLNVAFDFLHWQTSYFNYVKKHYKIELNTELMLTHWDVRPLRQAYREKVVQTEHCLVHAGRAVRNALVDAGKLNEVLSKCNLCCLRQQTPKEPFKRDKPFPGVQFLPANEVAVMEALNQWRYRVAVELNYKPNILLRKKHLRTLAKDMPTTAEGVMRKAKAQFILPPYFEEIKHIIISLKDVIGPVYENPDEAEQLQKKRKTEKYRQKMKSKAKKQKISN